MDGDIELHTGHQNVVCAVAFTADSGTLVSGSFDGTVKIWDVATGSLVRTLACGPETVAEAVAIAPDGQVVAAAVSVAAPRGVPSEVRLWNATTGKLIRASEERVHALVFADDGRVLYGSRVHTEPRDESTLPAWRDWKDLALEVSTWDAQTGAAMGKFTTVDESLRAAYARKLFRFGSDGYQLRAPGLGLVVCVGRALQLFDTNADALLWECSRPDEMFFSAAIAPDGSYVATSASSGTVRLHDVRTGSVRREWTGHQGSIYVVEFSPDGWWVAGAGEDATIRIWHVADLEPPKTLGSPKNAIQRVAVAPDGKTLASASVDGSVRLWDSGRLRLDRTLTGDSGQITGLAFSPDGRWLACGSLAGTIRLWDAANGALKYVWSAFHQGVCALAYTPDGSEVVAFGPAGEYSHDVEIKVWDVHTGALCQWWGTKANAWHMRPGALSADGRLLATHDYKSGRVRLSETVATAIPRFLGDDQTDVSLLAFSPDGETLFGVGISEHATLWSTRTGAPIVSFPLHRGSPSSIAFSQDASLLAVGACYRNSVTLWNVNAGVLVQTLSGHRGPVRSIACTPDGQRVISGSADGTVKLWDPASGCCLGTLAILPAPDGGEVSLNWAAYAPDGRFRASPGARRFLRRRAGDQLVPIEAWGFEEWLAYYFDRPVTGPSLDHQEEPLPEECFQVTISHMTRLCNSPAILLDRYTHSQICQGFWLLLHQGSDDMSLLFDDRILVCERRRCIEAMRTLFERLFAGVCTDHLSHLDRGASAPEHVNPINLVCYMWWDILAPRSEPADSSRAELEATILSVLGQILRIPSTVCQESALYGLGHWYQSDPGRVEEIVDRFLQEENSLRPELREYALRARPGDIL